MAAPYRIIRNFSESLGVDFASSDLTRSNRHLAKAENVAFTERGGLTKRYGQHLVVPGEVYAGLFEHTTTDISGVQKTELLGAGDTLYRLVERPITLTCTGGGAGVVRTRLSPASGWFFEIEQPTGNVILSVNMGFGDETSPYLMSTLVAAIDALADWTCTSSLFNINARNVPAADVSTVDDNFTLAAHGLRRGQRVRLTTSGAVPAGLTAGSTYVVTSRTDSVFSLGNTLFATINLTSIGSGTHTLTPAIPAACIQRVDDRVTGVGSFTLSFYLWQAVNSPQPAGAASFKSVRDAIGTARFKNVSGASFNGNLYLAGLPPQVAGASLPADSQTTCGLMKYDGQRFYRAGVLPDDGGWGLMSAVTTGSLTDVRGTRTVASPGAGTYRYGYYYVQVDKTGQRHESSAVLNLGTVAPTGAQVPRLEFDAASSYHLKANAGFNIGKAQVSGNQPGVSTIVVSSAAPANEIEAGDLIFFWDNGQGRFIQRIVDSRTDSTITIQTTSLDSDPNSQTYDVGGTVSVLDAALITLNFRIGILRTKTGGAAAGPYYLVCEAPYGAGVFFDSLADGSLVIEYTQASYTTGLPPLGSIVSATREGLLISGIPWSPADVHFSETEKVESFPVATHYFTAPQAVTALGPSGDVTAVMGQRSIDIVSGSLGEFQFRLDRVSSSIGCVAHDSLRPIEEGVLFFASERGPYQLTNGRDLRPIGGVPSGSELVSPLEPYFTGSSVLRASASPAFSRATATVLPKQRLYLLYIPHEQVAGFDTGDVTATVTEGVLFAWDYGQGAWTYFTRLLGGAGMANYQDILWIAGRDGGGALTRCLTYRQQLSAGKKNWCDQREAIAMVATTHDEAQGLPGVFKKFVRIGAYILETLGMSTVAYKVKTFTDWDQATAQTDATRTITTEKSFQVKVKTQKARSLRVSFENAELEQSPIISGYEIETAQPFRQGLKD